MFLCNSINLKQNKLKKTQKKTNYHKLDNWFLKKFISPFQSHTVYFDKRNNSTSWYTMHFHVHATVT